MIKYVLVVSTTEILSSVLLLPIMAIGLIIALPSRFYKKAENKDFKLTFDIQAFDWINNTDPIQRITHLTDLTENWDGYHAPSFSHHHVNRAMNLHNYLLKQLKEQYTKNQPFVAPCSDGSILFEWSGKRFPDKQLEIFIPSDENELIEYLKTSEDGEEEGKIKEDQFLELIQWLLQQFL